MSPVPRVSPDTRPEIPLHSDALCFTLAVHVSHVRARVSRDNGEREVRRVRRVPATPSFKVNGLDEMILSPSHDVHYFLWI